MSWQAYVDDHIVGLGGATGGAIAALDGTEWAASEGMSGKITAEEVQALVAAFDDPSGVYINGAWLAGVKYRVMAVKPDLHWIHLNLKAEDEAKTDVHVIRTGRAVLFALNDGTSAEANDRTISKVVQELGDYLRGEGF